MGYVLGVDGGGTKTVCLLMDFSGEIKGRGEAGPSNYQSLGVEPAYNSIRSAIARALDSAKEAGRLYGKIDDKIRRGEWHSPEVRRGEWHSPEGKIRAIGLGLAGAGREEDLELLRSWVERLHSEGNLSPDLALLDWAIEPEGVFVGNDCAILLAGGTGSSVGVAVISGTGSIAYGQNRQGAIKRAGGWGYLLGDEGSSYDIAVRGLRAAARSYDGRDRQSVLGDKLISHLGLERMEDLVSAVYRRGWGVKDIAALAPVVDAAAAAGDTVAIAIIDRAAEELVLAGRAVMEELFLPEEAFDIVTAGGAWKGMAGMRDRFVAAMEAIAPSARVIWPRHEPAYGAALLALRQLGKTL